MPACAGPPGAAIAWRRGVPRLLPITVALVALSGSVARAQTCTDGRIDLEGHCCWPGQDWSFELGRCDGGPTCPPFLVAHGESCIAPVRGEHVEPAPGPPPMRASTTRWPLAADHEDAPRASAREVRGEDEPLLVGALLVFDIGWIVGLMGISITECRASCGNLAFGGMPLVGGVLAALTTSGYSYPFGISSVVIQSFALVVLLPIALVNETTELAFPALDVGDAEASLELAAAGSDVGASLRIDF